jgi:sugar/nucleoside kinase (ribokinase family)
MYDAYCYGMISASTVYVLREDFLYPRANEYAEIGKAYHSIGGEAVNSAIMLSKLGLKTKLDGNWLNPEKAVGIRRLLEPYGIDISRLTVKQDRGTEEIVITDRESRTVFGNYAAFHSGEKQWNDPDEEDVVGARIVGIDPYFKADSERLARLCVIHGIPYVTLDCAYDGYVAQNAASVIVSHELRDQAYRGRDPAGVFEKFLEHCRGLTIFSFGADELWYGRPGGQFRKMPPFKIVPVDTTGAGDSFRAGIMYGLLQGWNDETVVEFASAVAACVCLSIPHTLNAPGLDGVLDFLAKRGKNPA